MLKDLSHSSHGRHAPQRPLHDNACGRNSLCLLDGSSFGCGPDRRHSSTSGGERVEARPHDGVRTATLISPSTTGCSLQVRETHKLSLRSWATLRSSWAMRWRFLRPGKAEITNVNVVLFRLFRSKVCLSYRPGLATRACTGPRLAGIAGFPTASCRGRCRVRCRVRVRQGCDNPSSRRAPRRRCRSGVSPAARIG